MKVSVVLFKSDGKGSDNTYPIKVVVSHKAKKARSTISRSQLIDWDSENNVPLITHPGYDYLYPEILTIRAKVFDRFVRESENVNHVLEFIKGITQNTQIDFYVFAQKRIEFMTLQNRLGNASVYSTAIGELKKYAPTLYFDDLTGAFLEGFKEFKKSQLVAYGPEEDLRYKKIKNSTIANYLRALRAIYNQCVKLNGLVNGYPFKGVFSDIPLKKRRVNNVYLDKVAIKTLENATGLTTAKQRVVDLCLLQFYLCGLDFVDLFYLKHEQLANERVYITRIKLGEKGEVFDVKLFEKAKRLIDKYATPGEYVFGWDKDRDKYRGFRRNYARDLNLIIEHLQIKTLPKPATVATKTIRHSFATIAKFLFIEVDVIRELMGHERTDIDTVYKDTYPEKTRDEAHFKIIE